MPKLLLPLALAANLAACGLLAPEGEAPADHAATYRCDSGQVIRASYPSDSSAVVRYAGRRLAMTLAISGSGARYVGGDLEWWTKGNGPGSNGMLLRHEGDGRSGDIVQRCTQVAAPVRGS